MPATAARHRCQAVAVAVLPLKKESRSALIRSALVAGMPCGRPRINLKCRFLQ